MTRSTSGTDVLRCRITFPNVIIRFMQCTMCCIQHISGKVKGNMQEILEIPPEKLKSGVFCGILPV